jgi:hypothetical protein
MEDSRKELRTFIALTIGLSAVFNYLIITKGMAYVLGVMWTPGSGARSTSTGSIDANQLKNPILLKYRL